MNMFFQEYVFPYNSQAQTTVTYILIITLFR